ncbi:hypothetical protein Dsin_017452 [Dipteronia sinensis]|uniref:Uncharacterized protein n=1 Tax=Dipteronia sinensis TaxID=43782 RepID=A0AAE0AFJ6_9ROSI|nr:hypothetical protein Dsin_017452 [Dipteronia sinensis]
MIDDYELIGIRYKGSRFTRARGRYTSTLVEKRLDRDLVHNGCVSCWRDISCVALPRRFSDHSLLLIQFWTLIPRPMPFRFQSMWFYHSDFLDIARRVWSPLSIGSHP